MGELHFPTAADYAASAADSAKRSALDLEKRVAKLEAALTAGLPMRDYLAAHAPIDARMAEYQFGGPCPMDDPGRASFLAVWAMLRYEYADAMIEERGGL